MTHADNGGPSGNLPCALYLLACDLDRECLTKRSVIGHVLRAAVLLELTERGCLRDEDGKARTVGDRRTGEPLLDDALRRLTERSRSMKWKALIGVDRKQTLEAVEESLRDSGTITVRPRRWRNPRIVVDDPELLLELRGSVARTLKGGLPVLAVPSRQAALVALTAAGELPGVLTGRERRQYKQRIKELTQRAGEAAPALKKVLNEMQYVAVAVSS